MLPWNGLRTYGPLPSMRWDPHPGEQPASDAEGSAAATEIGYGIVEEHVGLCWIDFGDAGAG